MAAVLAGNAEIVTGLPPLGPWGAMRFLPDAGKGDEMGEFVQEGVAQFGVAGCAGQVLQPGFSSMRHSLAKARPAAVRIREFHDTDTALASDSSPRSLAKPAATRVRASSRPERG